MPGVSGCVRRNTQSVPQKNICCRSRQLSCIVHKIIRSQEEHAIHADHHPAGEPITLPNGTTVPLSPAYPSRGFLLLPGKLAFNDNGSPPTGAIVAQTERCLGTLESLSAKALIAEESVAEATAPLTDVQDFPGFNASQAGFFCNHRPAPSTVCGKLLMPRPRVEIAVNRKPGQGKRRAQA